MNNILDIKKIMKNSINIPFKINIKNTKVKNNPVWRLIPSYRFNEFIKKKIDKIVNGIAKFSK